MTVVGRKFKMQELCHSAKLLKIIIIKIYNFLCESSEDETGKI